MSAIAFWLISVRGVAAGVSLGLEFLEDLLDAILMGDRLVVEELQLRRAAQAQPLRNLAPQEGRGAAECFRRLLQRLFVAHRRVVDAGELKVGRNLDAGQ